jgi:hypothetical protein
MVRSFRGRHGALLVLVAALIGAPACESETPVTPTVPDPTTDTFTGRLTKNGAATFPFTVKAGGNISASLATLGPDSTTVVGLSLGTWNGTACAIVIANDAAVQGTIVLGQTTGSGSLCVRIFDVGNVVDPLDFTINVIHP